MEITKAVKPFIRNEYFSKYSEKYSANTFGNIVYV